jgi:penicillin-binding protein 2
VSRYLGSEDDVRELQPRIKVVYAAILTVAAILSARLWFLQIIQGSELREYSEKNRLKETKIRAPRGLLLDREGRILVDNSLGFDVTITPQYVMNLKKIAQDISPIIKIPIDKIVSDVEKSRRKNGPFMPVRVKDNLTLDEVYRVERLKIEHPGLDVEKTILRYYPLDENGAQLFGYVGEVSKKQLESLNKKRPAGQKLNQGDIIGQSGIEDAYDEILRGADGLQLLEVDAHGRSSRGSKDEFMGVKSVKAVPGNNILLTIDKDIQIAAHKAMLEQKDRLGPRIGGVVALTAEGEILAWVVAPSFNPNKFARGIAADIWKELVDHPFKPLRNKIAQDHFSPGSTFKPFVALSALQEGIITERTIVSAPGQMSYGNRIYHDSLKQGHGEINVTRAIESSSNVFFYKMGISLGIDNIAKYAFLLGLGQKTGVSFSNEAQGLIPTKEWKQKTMGEPWQPGENLSNAIGQGFVLTNLLQLAMAYNAIGLEGLLYKPIVVRKITDPEGHTVKEFSTELVRDASKANADGVFISKQNFQIVKRGLEQVANGPHGTARWWKIPGIPFAGKTGTTQVMSFRADDIYTKCETRPIQLRHHGTFIGYAPADKPEIVVAAMTEHSCHGNTGSVPVIRDIMLAYFKKYKPELMKNKLSVGELSPRAAREAEEVEE